ncbi:hypothetical protein FC831_13880 [Clostridium botulinum]|nr:hypothetical protein [Clostridium botulinum]
MIKTEAFWVADFKLNEGKINNCCVWKDKEKGLDLEIFFNEPMVLKDKYKTLFVQNKYTSIILKTKYIKDIKIRRIESKEW